VRVEGGAERGKGAVSAGGEVKGKK
jgi:hypothetical protein